MNITITNSANRVRLDYNDVRQWLIDNGQAQAASTIFSKARSILKASVQQLRLAPLGEYVEIVYTDGHSEQFQYFLFEGYASNEELFNALDAMIL